MYSLYYYFTIVISVRIHHGRSMKMFRKLKKNENKKNKKTLRNFRQREFKGKSFKKARIL